MKQSERQAILEAHIEKYGGFNPRHFEELAEDPGHPAHEWYYPDGWQDRAQKAWVGDRTIRFLNGLRIEVPVGPLTPTVDPAMVPTPIVVADLSARQEDGSRYRGYWEEAAQDQAMNDQVRRYVLLLLEKFPKVLGKTETENLRRMVRVRERRVEVEAA